MATTNAVVKKEKEAALPEITRGGTHYTPRVDIFETEEELLFECDMPGVKPSDLELRFERGELTIYGRVHGRASAQSYLLAEYGIGDFYRAFSVTEDIDPDKISAEFKHGVLTVYLPKKESAKPKRIKIKA